MSPMKPKVATAAPRQRVSTRSTAASSIPRRALAPKTTTTTKTKKPVAKPTRSAAAPVKRTTRQSVLDGTATTTASSSRPSLFQASRKAPALSDDKENIGSTGSRPSRRYRAVSPTKGKTGVCKPAPARTQTTTSSRVPLRELSEVEVFERDEIVLGDIRRRRSGEHSGSYIEFESHQAPASNAGDVDEDLDAAVPEPTASTNTPAMTRMRLRASSIADSLQPSPSSDLDLDLSLPYIPEPTEKPEKIKVLRRTSSVESLQRKVEAIMAATASASGPTTRSALKKKSSLSSVLYPSHTPQKSRHPAVRADSPDLADTSDILANSPILAPRAASPISKSSPSPVRPLRMGLGTKNVNALLKEAVKAGAENAGKKGGKMVMTASNAGGVGGKGGMVKKKATTGVSSLKRAAGGAVKAAVKPATATIKKTASAVAADGLARTRLQGIGRMR